MAGPDLALGNDEAAMTGLADLFIRLRERSGGAGKTGYVSEYSVPPHGFLEERVGRTVPDGLVAWYLIRASNGEYRVASYWSSKDAFLRDNELWGRAIGGQLLPGHGWVGRIEALETPWLKRIRLHHLVLAIAGVLAALETIKNHADRLAAAPSIAIRHDPRAANVIEAQPFELKATLENQIAALHTDVHVTAALSRKLPPHTSQIAPPTLEMVVSEPEIPQLPSSASKSLVLAGKAPPPGQYLAEIVAEASAGWFRCPRTFRASREVTVWPSSPLARVQGLSVTEARGKLVGHVDVGPEAEHGLDCEFRVVGFADLRFLALHTSVHHLNREWLSATTPGREVHLLTWSTPRIREHQTIGLEVMLEGTKGTSWDAVGKSSRLVCVPRDRGVMQ